MSDGRAKAGVDYRPQSGKITLRANQTSESITLTNVIIDNGRVDGGRSFRINLTNPSPGSFLVSPYAEVFIDDNEIPNNLDRSFHVPVELRNPQLLGSEPNGNLLIATYFKKDWGVARLLPNGTLDPNFQIQLTSTNSAVSSTGAPIYPEIGRAHV